MRLGRIDRRKRKRQSESVILFSVASQTFAIAAQAVEEIRNLDGLLTLPHGIAKERATNKVWQALDRDRKIYFVVDANVHFRLPRSNTIRLLLLRDMTVALSVDAVNRMAEIVHLHALPRAFQGEERQWFRGLAVIEGEVIPVVNPEALLDSRTIEALQAAYIAAEEAAKPVRSAASA